MAALRWVSLKQVVRQEFGEKSFWGEMVPRSSSRRVRKEVGEGGQREGQRGGWERRLSPWGPEGMAAMPRFHHSESRKLGFTQELTPICPSRGGRHRGLLGGGAPLE